MGVIGFLMCSPSLVVLLLVPAVLARGSYRPLFAEPGAGATSPRPAAAAPTSPSPCANCTEPAGSDTAMLRSYLVARGYISKDTNEGTAAEVSKVAQALAAVLQPPSNNTSNTTSSHNTFIVNGTTIAGNDIKAIASIIDSLWCADHKEQPRCSRPQGSNGGDYNDGNGEEVVIHEGSPAADYAYLYGYGASATALTYLDVAQQVTMYNGGDLLWAESIAESALNRGNIVYRPAPTPTAKDTYTYPMRSLSGSGSKITIGLIGDWGTGMPQAFDMLQQMQQQYRPDLVLHLGDVYYGGSTNEQMRYQCEPVRQYLPKGVQYYTLPGNHDYYSGGGPFLACVDSLRGDGITKQESSFFALEGDSWMFINMDTGRHDSDVNSVDSEVTYLDDNQAQWVIDKVHQAKDSGKRVLFSSHHQLFTLASSVGKVDDAYPATNPRLYNKLKDVLPSVDIWFWGHEHNIMAFEPYAGLKRGRLLGASAVPILRSTKPYYTNTLLQPSTFAGESELPKMIQGGPMSDLAKFGLFEQHSFAVMTLDGPSATVNYYQMDWDCSIVPFHGGCTWYPPTIMWSERL